MKKGPKLYQMVGLSLVIVGVMMFSGLAYATHSTNNVKGHSDFSGYSDVSGTNACRDCHPRSGDQFTSAATAFAVDAQEPNQDPSSQKISDFHTTHLNSAFLTSTFKACSYCHKSAAVDDTKSDVNANSSVAWGKSMLRTDGSSMQGIYATLDAEDYASPGYTNGLGARRTVSSGICVRCHGKFNKTGSHGSVDKTATAPYGCTSSGCHRTGSIVGAPSTSHALGGTTSGSTLIVSAYGNNRYFCWMCHGGKSKLMVTETNIGDAGYND